MVDVNVKQLRKVLAELDRQRSLVEATQLQLSTEGYKFETRIMFFVNLSVHLLSMAQEALSTTCDTIAQCPVSFRAEEVIKSWDFEDEHDISGYQE